VRVELHVEQERLPALALLRERAVEPQMLEPLDLDQDVRDRFTSSTA
jgi:hypothetical protein